MSNKGAAAAAKAATAATATATAPRPPNKLANLFREISRKVEEETARGATTAPAVPTAKTQAEELVRALRAPMARQPVGSNKPINAFAQGSHGRMSRGGKTISIFGASGFIARYVVNSMGREGWLMRVATRGDDMSVRHLKPLADYGRLAPHYWDWRDPESIAAAIPPGTDVVLNLVGKHYDTKHIVPWWVNNTVEESHVRVTEALAKAARRAGVKHFVQVSSAKAEANSPSLWARSKFQSEQAASAEFPGATIVRLGQVYGEEDRFLNFWAWAAKKSPVLPLVDDGAAVLRPVVVGDVAVGLHAVCLNWDAFAGETVELLGKDAFTLKQIVEYVSRTIGANPTLVSTSTAGPLGAVGAALEKLPNPLFTRDQLELMRCSDKSTPKAVTFDTLGIEPVAFQSKAYNYLFRYRSGGHFVELRKVEEGMAKGPVHVSHQVGQ